MILRKLLRIIVFLLPKQFINKKAFRAQLYPKIYYKNGLRVEQINDTLTIFKGNKCIKVDKKNAIYLDFDIANNFDFYFSAVKPKLFGYYLLVDYSKATLHKVIGYNLHKVKIPSIMEPIDAVKQYLDFFDLTENSIVLDLGSYSGLTSILFDRAISIKNPNAKGKVITVEADKGSFEAVEYNTKKYLEKTGRKIKYLFGAIWNKDGKLEFSTESNLAASVVEAFNHCRGEKTIVPSYKISTVAKMFCLEKIDCIKCDIEGAEAQMVEDSEFFRKYKPKIIMEIHDYFDSTTVFDKVKKTLESYNYSVKKVKQKDGFFLPLLECEYIE